MMLLLLLLRMVVVLRFGLRLLGSQIANPVSDVAWYAKSPWHYVPGKFAVRLQAQKVEVQLQRPAITF